MEVTCVPVEDPPHASRRHPLSRNIRATPIDEADLQFLVPIVLQQLRIYPESLLRDLHVSLVLAGDVWYGGVKQGVALPPDESAPPRLESLAPSVRIGEIKLKGFTEPTEMFVARPADED